MGLIPLSTLLRLTTGDPALRTPLNTSRLTEPRHYTGQIRQCSLCRRVQPIEAFSRDSKKAHGRDQECKLCNMEPRGSWPAVTIAVADQTGARDHGVKL